jgi:hypothetical protein
MTIPSLRRLWALYKHVALAQGDHSKRELALMQDAFYTGARGVLKIGATMIERGKIGELHKMIERHGRQIEKIRGRRPRSGRH